LENKVKVQRGIKEMDKKEVKNAARSLRHKTRLTIKMKACLQILKDNCSKKITMKILFTIQ